MPGRKSGPGRLRLPDVIRGITLISMILYHGAWDLVYIAGVNWPWYHSRGAYLWQQSICWTFILLSGFCIPLASSRRAKRGLIIFAAGLLVTAVTLLFLPEDRVVFGVLTFIGSALLIAAASYPFLERVHPAAGLAVSAYLFWMCFPVNSGYLRLLPGKMIRLPEAWYHGMYMTFLGFPDRSFYSTDYFSLLPWIFLYGAGIFLCLLLRRRGLLRSRLLMLDIPPFSFLGRHSLAVYLAHQPVLYALCSLWMALRH